MASVTLKEIYKIYEKDVVAVKDFNIEIKDKEFVVLVGPSGCGKSTTLRMIAGLEEISKGELYIDDCLVNNIQPKERDIAMVFQNYALYPHMTVYNNMAFSLKLRKFSKAQIEERVNKAAKILGIEDLLQRKPKQLSGGQRQRVAIGRAIVREPKVFLMDEPLSNLDAKLRNQMRAELIKLHKELDTTFIYVTHDQIEAMTLGTRIVVMKDGVIQQVGTPYEIFEKPANMFVAGFIGTPQMNLFNDGKLVLENGAYYIDLYGKKFILPEDKQKTLKSKSIAGCEVIVGVRPEDFEVSQKGKESILAKIDVTELMGSEAYVHVKIPAGQGLYDLENEGKKDDIESEAVLRVKSTLINDEQTEIYIAPVEGKIHLFNKDTLENML